MMPAGTDPLDVAIQIPDEVGRALAARSLNLTRAVLEAVAIEAYRTSAISSAQVQEMLGFRSRWETEGFLRQAEAYHDYTMDDLDQDIAAIRGAARQ
jgi:predicted HTH domain antitoxin